MAWWCHFFLNGLIKKSCVFVWKEWWEMWWILPNWSNYIKTSFKSTIQPINPTFLYECPVVFYLFLMPARYFWTRLVFTQLDLCDPYFCKSLIFVGFSPPLFFYLLDPILPLRRIPLPKFGWAFPRVDIGRWYWWPIRSPVGLRWSPVFSEMSITSTIFKPK